MYCDDYGPTDTSDTKEVSDYFGLDLSGIYSPVMDEVQDYPTAWDWRLVVGFVLIAVWALYV